jgi:hypothetical protein
MKKQSTTPAQNPKCKGCGIEYNRDNVAREYGAESMVYLGGYHSAACYTDGISKEQPIDKSALIEICGSVVPISEVERVWMLHCATTPTPGTDAQPEQGLPNGLDPRQLRVIYPNVGDPQDSNPGIFITLDGENGFVNEDPTQEDEDLSNEIKIRYNQYPELEARNRELVEALRGLWNDSRKYLDVKKNFEFTANHAQVGTLLHKLTGEL